MKDNDFVKQAFADATEAEKDKEFEAFQKSIDRGGAKTASVAASIFLGVGKVEEMRKAIGQAGMLEFFADFTTKIYSIGFHYGYIGRKEEE